MGRWAISEGATMDFDWPHYTQSLVPLLLAVAMIVGIVIWLRKPTRNPRPREGGERPRKPSNGFEELLRNPTGQPRSVDCAGRLRNPLNGYEESVEHAGLWCLLFGCFYFAYKGVWLHASIAFFVAWFTFGLSWLAYPFFARRVIIQHYQRQGWELIAAQIICFALPRKALRLDHFC
jgi:hypothetical protein